MKTRLTRKAKQMASSLLTTLVICTILSMFVMYYLSLIDQQSYLSSRSQVWNMAIAISEAGIEDGMAEINSSLTYPAISGDGWSGSNNVFNRTNTLPDGNSYVVTVITTNIWLPAVVCRANVYNIPKYGRNASSSFFAAIGYSAQQGGTTNRIVTRAVSVICKRDNLFITALAAKTGIDLNGNGVYTDSFNSNMPGVESDIYGRYNSSIYSGDRGDVGTNGGITNAGIVSVQNANVYGTIHTGPNAPVSIGANGGVGPHCCQARSVPAAISAGYIRQDANFTFPDTAYPNTSGYWAPYGPGYLMTVSNWISSYTTNSITYPNPVPPGGVTVVCGPSINSPIPPPPVPLCASSTNNNNGSRQYVYSLVDHYSWTVSLTNSLGYTNYYDHIVYGNGCPTLGGNGSLTNPWTMCPIPNSGTNKFVCANLNGKTAVVGTNTFLALPNGLTGSEDFTIVQSSAVLVFAGNNSVTSCSISGGAYVNANGHATSFMVFCPPSVTSFNFSGNGQFTGVFIAPNADMQLNGGGGSNEDFCGCLMMNSVSVNGHFSFHWDEGLLDTNFNGRFLVQTWNEVK